MLLPLLMLLIFLFTLLRFGVVGANFLTQPWLRRGELVKKTKVSVLIPARNEEENITALLTGIVANLSLGGADPELEILVYDDQSTDQTAEMARQHGARVISGIELPDGWLGKNHACHRLAQEASGDWFLFLDADVEVGSNLIRDAVAFAQMKKVRLLSIFPKQEMESSGEWSVVPIMNWILVSLLPMVMVRVCRWKSFSAANGQFMLFDAALYRRFQWHEKVKNDPVEDIRICRMMKRSRFRVATLLGTDSIRCRMYRSHAEALSGFTKNIGQFFGNSRLWMLLFALLTTLSPIISILFLAFPPMPRAPMPQSPFFQTPFFQFIITTLASPWLPILNLFLLLSIRILFSLVSRQSVIKNLILWPVQHLNFLILVARNLAFRRGGQIDWKGRKIGL